MAGIHGKNGKIVIGTSAEVEEVTDWSIEETADTVEDSAMSSSIVAKTFLTGLTEWTANITTNRNRADTDGQVTMRAGLNSAFKLYAEGSGTGKKYFSGTGIITKFGESGSIGGKVSATYTVKGNGSLTESTA